MKIVPVFLLAWSLATASDEIEGEVWYDAQGKVAYVEGPAAAKSEERFVPAWERRESQRSESRARFHRGTDFRWRWYGDPGWSVSRPRVVMPYRPWSLCPQPRRSGATIILRR